MPGADAVGICDSRSQHQDAPARGVASPAAQLDPWAEHPRLRSLASASLAVKQLREQGADWLSVEWLPPYAPDLANYVPSDKWEIFDSVIELLGRAVFVDPGPADRSRPGCMNLISAWQI